MNGSGLNENVLLYNEPNITIILIVGSFLLLLNLVGYALDRFFYCGLVGQIFLGVAWGIPGAKWLSLSMQESVGELGYLGLILLVYEGGLSSDIRAIRSNLLMSSLSALTGVLATIGISFILMVLVDASPLQAFAAGAALSSTSLGTTFTLLKNSGLISSHSGVIIASAAVLDDVTGLIMAQVISKLGSDSTFNAVTVIRPVFVSIAFAVGVPTICCLLIKPTAKRLRACYALLPINIISNLQFSFVVHTTILIGFVVASSYAGTSNLFGAYIAGACIRWYDSDITTEELLSSNVVSADGIDLTQYTIPLNNNLNHILRSRVAETTQSNAVIEGMSCKLVALECPSPVLLKNQDNKFINEKKKRNFKHDGINDSKYLGADDGEYFQSTDDIVTGKGTWDTFYEKPVSLILKPFFFSSIGFSIPISQMFDGSTVWRGLVFSVMMVLAKLLCGIWLVRFCYIKNLSCFSNSNNQLQTFPRIKSLYPAILVGSAMVARGEIGFLVAAIAQSRGIFTPEQFLVVIWSIVLCTIIGPIAVGFLSRKA
ncbi:hypothetical protein HG535_0E00150 [Zygotorulaspora mrakii]|uniref:Cation/H+ exchanger transmembrane domain-containing protein n=1 Tax=Zygotorulaspora mrakii TaxID=42260 RepID=A0A7H9B2P8_ZYGMR|nr:uncharacterized protein HG535_0E00150 [Zygotorulaspora mrakii]QLG72931.1 hypothetical protein HG535_0E00150 [Zygotorulaspora mrakii]